MPTAAANIPKFLCRVKSDSCFGHESLGDGASVLFAITEPTTVSEVHQMVQRITGQPTEGFAIGFGLNWNLPGDSPILPFWNRQAPYILTLQLHPAGSNPMIYVKSLTGETLAYDVSPRQSILDLKLKIQEKQGIPFDQARLIFAGQMMENGKQSFRL